MIKCIFISLALLLTSCAPFPIIEEEGLTVVQFDTDTVRRMCGPDAEWNHHVYGCYFAKVKLLVCDEGDNMICSEHACLIVKTLRGEDDLDACYIPVPKDYTIYTRNCHSPSCFFKAMEDMR